MVDSSGLLDLEGEGVPDIFLIAGISLLVFLIAFFGFQGFRQGNLGLIVTAILFLVTLVSYSSLVKNTTLSEGHILDGALGFTIGSLAFNLQFLFGGNFSFTILSTATESYLSAILGSSTGIVIPLINNIFAPLGETFLIFGLTAGIWEVVKRTRLADNPLWQITLVIGLIPSIIFAGLHGARQPSFLLLAFSINMFWTALLVYGELGGFTTKYVPFGLGLIGGLHFSFNTSSYGGIPKFVFDLWAAVGTNEGAAALATLGFLFLMWSTGTFRGYQIAMKQEVFG